MFVRSARRLGVLLPSPLGFGRCLVPHHAWPMRALSTEAPPPPPPQPSAEQQKAAPPAAEITPEQQVEQLEARTAELKGAVCCVHSCHAVRAGRRGP